MLASLAARGVTGRDCPVWNSFAKHGVGQGARGVVEGKGVPITASFSRPSGC